MARIIIIINGQLVLGDGHNEIIKNEPYFSQRWSESATNWPQTIREGADHMEVVLGAGWPGLPLLPPVRRPLGSLGRPEVPYPVSSDPKGLL